MNIKVARMLHKYYTRVCYYFVIQVIILLLPVTLHAQYFGRNKPSYKVFDYKLYTTPHFEIYHYLQNDSVLKSLGQMSEQWYMFHQFLFNDTFKIRNPIIIYNN